MIIKPELIEKIRTYFSLNIYETKVWLALLSKGIASAGEIAEMSNVPRSRTYDVLESLEKQGFAIPKLGKPTKYIAVKPIHVLEKMKREAFIKAKEKAKILDNLKLKEEYEILKKLHKNSFKPVKQEEISGAIKGKSNILRHAHELIKNAEKEVIICLPASELLDKSRILNNLFDKLSNNKIKIKLAVKGEDKELKQIQRKYNIKPKKTNLKSKFFIVDRGQVLLSLNNTKNDDELAVWLNSDFFSSSFAHLFDQAHKK